MMRSQQKSIIILLAVIISGLFMSVFTVQETQKAIVLCLGNIVEKDGKPYIYEPGLHLKWPFIEGAYFFDRRLQTILISSSRMMTKEKKDVIVDLFVKWRIKDIPTFYTKTGGNFSRADNLLKQRIIDGVRAEFGKRTIQEVVSGEREDVMQRLLKDAAEGARELGMEVVDTRIKRIDLPEEVSGSVYSRMRSERQRIAEEYRAMGQSKAEMKRARADAEVTVLLAKAQEEATIIRGKGEALSANIAGKAYSRDPRFYRFYKSLEAYKESFTNKNDVLILKPDKKGFFQYFRNPEFPAQ
jgi:modulator of FtsH protease HflC